MAKGKEHVTFTRVIKLIEFYFYYDTAGLHQDHNPKALGRRNANIATLARWAFVSIGVYIRSSFTLDN